MPTSGGNANAIELKAKAPEDGGGGTRVADTNSVWIALTDDKRAADGLWILKWDYERGGHKARIQVVAECSFEGGGHGRELADGANHAVWLD